MVNRIEIEQLLQSKKMKELWQTIQQELPQLHFYEENDSWEEARIDYLENYISECNTLLCKCNFQEISIKDLYTLSPPIINISSVGISMMFLCTSWIFLHTKTSLKLLLLDSTILFLFGRGLTLKDL